jgi:hypothetical protein
LHSFVINYLFIFQLPLVQKSKLIELMEQNHSVLNGKESTNQTKAANWEEEARDIGITADQAQKVYYLIM